METALLSCPFCGGHGKTIDGFQYTSHPKLEESAYGGWRVICYGCGVNTWNYSAPEEAVRVWNKRA